MWNKLKKLFDKADPQSGPVPVYPRIWVGPDPETPKVKPYYTYVNGSEDEKGRKIFYEQLKYVSGSISHPERDTEFPHLAHDVITWIQKGIEENPNWEEYKVNASFSSYTLVGFRRESDQEYAERLQKEKEYADEDAKREYQEFLKLKELYEPN
jgi:hypothetical protein